MSAADQDPAAVADIIRGHAAKPELLVQILVDIVERFGWVSEQTIRQLAEELNLSRAEVHGVVSFYHDFRSTPPGRHIIRICQAEACQAMGSRALTEHAEQRVGTSLNGTSKSITLEPVYCLGNCACAPAVMIGTRTYGRVDAKRFDSLLDKAREDAV